MITLTVNKEIVENETKLLAKEGLMDMILESVQGFKDFVENTFTNFDTLDKTVFSINDTEGDNGVSYKSIKFIITSIFVVDGERYFSDGTFQVSADKVIKILDEIVDEINN